MEFHFFYIYNHFLERQKTIVISYGSDAMIRDQESYE